MTRKYIGVLNHYDKDGEEMIDGLILNTAANEPVRTSKLKSLLTTTERWCEHLTKVRAYDIPAHTIEIAFDRPYSVAMQVDPETARQIIDILLLRETKRAKVLREELNLRQQEAQTIDDPAKQNRLDAVRAISTLHATPAAAGPTHWSKLVSRCPHCGQPIYEREFYVHSTNTMYMCLACKKDTPLVDLHIYDMFQRYNSAHVPHDYLDPDGNFIL